jgi:hypothetical protein
MNRVNRRAALATLLVATLVGSGVSGCSHDPPPDKTVYKTPVIPGHPNARGSETTMWQTIDKFYAKKQAAQGGQAGQTAPAAPSGQ